MGLFDNLWNKGVVAQKRPLASNEDYTPDDFSVEEKCYSSFTKNKLVRLRCDGVAVGLRIPTLLYPLKKPKKARASFLIFGIIASVLTAFFIYLMALVVKTTIIPLINSANDILGSNDSELLNVITFGFIEIFSGFSATAVYVICTIIALCLLAVLGFLFYFVITFFSLSKCSVQEMAKGVEIKSMIGWTVFLFIVSLILSGLLIYGFTTGGQLTNDSRILVIAIFSSFVFFTIMLITILIEKKIATKEFLTLPSYEQDDFINHSRAIERVKRRLTMINSFRNNNLNG